jgi:outer membrane autotransporter protein
LYGGRTLNGTAVGNAVRISGGTVAALEIVAGYANSSTQVTGNKVTITAGSVSGAVIGGSSIQLGIEVKENSVEISRGSIGTGNSLTMINGGAIGDYGKAVNNTVSISGAPVFAAGVAFYGGLYLSSGTGDVFTGNLLQKDGSAAISSAANFESVRFGYSGDAGIGALDLTPTGAAGAPLVKIDTGVHDVAFGGALTGAGGFEKRGAGTLTLSGSASYTGGTAVREGVLALGSDLASTQLALDGGAAFRTNGHVHSLDNGSLTVTGEGAIYDGDLSAKNAVLKFIAPFNVTQPLLMITGEADVSGSQVSVGLTGGTELAPGAKLTLLKTTRPEGLTAANLTEGAAIAESGVTAVYDLALSADPATGELSGTVASGAAPEESKALSEGFVSGVGLLGQGADHAAGKGMEGAAASARAAARSGASAGGALSGFGCVSGGSLRLNSGSHADLRSVSLVAGLAWGADLAPGRLTLGMFLEYRSGSYDTYNSFASAAPVRGQGDVRHAGGGVLARVDFADTGPVHAYAEASARAGGIRNKYSSSDLQAASGVKAAYESSSAYYGFHLGAGWVWSLSGASSRDLYAKDFWTRQEGDSVTLSTGDRVAFRDADTSRLRLGARLKFAEGGRVSPYVGAAWEREFDGRARASASGFELEAPSLRGDTGMGEAGLTITPSDSLPLSFDVGVQGYTGKRDGVTGSVQVKIQF